MAAANELRGRGQRSHFFISYSRSDRIAVDEIHENLRARNYRLWMDVDEQGIEPGEDWQRELAVQMTAAEGVIACVSPDFLRSKYCQAEMAQAKQENKPIFPVLVRRLDEGQSLADMGIDNLQYVDLTADFDDGLKRLTAVMPRPPIQVKKIGLIATGIVALVAIAFAAFLLISAPSAVTPPATLPPSATATPPSLADYDLGVAVAYFALPDDDSVNQAEADALAERIGTLLQQDLIETLGETGLTVGFLLPVHFGRVTGDTPAARALTARELARRASADLVIYGQIKMGSAGMLDLQPEFYLVPEGFGEALEITGAYRFGSSIEVEGPLSATREALSINRLSARASAAAYTLAGLTFYGLEEYAEASEVFERALALPDWDDAEGRALVDTLTGNAHTRVATVAAQSGDMASARQHLDEADTHYQRARELAPHDARLYSGLASNAFLRWSIDAQQGSLELSLLDMALENVELAENASGDALDIGVSTRILLTRAQVRISQWAYHSDAYTPDELQAIYEDFEASAQQVIRVYDSAANPALQPLAAEAYYYLGTAQYFSSDWTAAADSYREAISLSTPRQRMFYYGYLGDALMQLASYDAAQVAYQEAVRLADSIGSVPESITDYYRRQLESLEGYGKP